jgi:hypothetical protein
VKWISVDERVPEDRREVLVWGQTFIGFRREPRFLGVSRFNPSPTRPAFDVEKGLIVSVVTHWAEITGPKEAKVVSPPRKP